jgi:hypothetical protein
MEDVFCEWALTLREGLDELRDLPVIPVPAKASEARSEPQASEGH